MSMTFAVNDICEHVYCAVLSPPPLACAVTVEGHIYVDQETHRMKYSQCN